MAIANNTARINPQDTSSKKKLQPTPKALQKEIHSCQKCPRLRNHCINIAVNKTKRFEQLPYSGLPVAGFGPLHPQNVQQLIVGLAPSAHGANRTGRMISGDQSGKWLYEVLYQVGESSHSGEENEDKDLQLKSTYITCAVKCAPPENKPTKEEFSLCFDYLVAEIQLYTSVRKYICLGALAWQQFNRAYCIAFGYPHLKRIKFKHNEKIITPLGHEIRLSYHPSQQNTFTGKLTWEEWIKVFKE